MTIPSDFPRDPWPAALTGAQPKLAARLIDGKYVIGLTPEERTARYDVCADLVLQLVAYCERKLRADPPAVLDELLPKVEQSLNGKGWETSPIEIAWCIRQVRQELLSKRQT